MLKPSQKMRALSIQMVLSSWVIKVREKVTSAPPVLDQPLLIPSGATKTVVPLDAAAVSRSYQGFIVPPLPVETLAAVPPSQ